MHSARLAHGKLRAFCGSTQTEVEAGTRTVKELESSKGPKLQPHIISCWRLEDFMRKNFGGRIGLGAVALGS